MMSLTFGLFTQVSSSGPLGPLVLFSWHNSYKFTDKILSCIYRNCVCESKEALF